MIVTCEHCSAKYKLDDAKIGAKGAKITCPKCRHVFVVYKGPEAAAAPAGAPASSTSAQAARPTVSTPAPAPSPPPRPAAPVVDPAPAAPGGLDVHSLDFRKVGIQAWKVKVKIGLVYEFTDYKTLRRYIQDGRVTASDTLSYDGENWVPIGSIPNLEQYFVQVYQAAERSNAAPASSDFDEADGPTMIAGFGEFSDALAALGAGVQPSSPTATAGLAPGGSAAAAMFGASPAVAAPLIPGIGDDDGGGDPARITTAHIPGLGGGSAALPPTKNDEDSQFIDPFEHLRRRQSQKIVAREAPKKTVIKKAARGSATVDKRAMSALLVSLLASGVCAFEIWYFWFRTPPKRDYATMSATYDQRAFPGMPGIPGAPGAPGTPGMPGSPSTVQSEYERQLQEALNQGREGGKLVPLDVDGDGEVDKIPVAPRGAPPVSMGSQPVSSGTPAAPATARDHAEAGADAARRGDWSGALSAYQKALALDGNNPNYLLAVGQAQARMGDKSGASSTLQRAISSGSADAYKAMAQLLKDQGDVAGANSYYKKYLDTNPADADAIRKEMAGGG